MAKKDTGNTTVLLIDDDIDLLLQLKMQLEAKGYTVETGESLTEAEEKIPAVDFDIAIVDLMMENLDDGFTISHLVKKKDESLPVILQTAVTRETGMEFEKNPGEKDSWLKADRVLAKPVRFEQLLREIELLLGN
jgi:CheY-like chemotaxis protein